MNVCMISYSFYESDNRVMRYAEALAARGDSVEIFALRHPEQCEEETLSGVRVFRIQARERNETSKLSYLLRILLFLVRASVLVGARHLRRPYALVHVHSVPDFLVFAALLPRLTGAKVILDIHDLLPELYATKFGCTPQSSLFAALQVLERVSTAFAHHVIAPNHIWQQKLTSRSVEAAKCSVFMNYPDPAVFRPQDKESSDDRFVVVYPGSLNGHQGLDVAIRAFAQISAEVPNAEFQIYGEGPAKEALISLADDLDIADKVVFHAPLPLRRIAVVMANSDLGIVPKRNDAFGDEAFSTKTLEFMMMGVPIILAETKVDRYYFNDEVVTFFPNGDADALARRMLKLIKDSELRKAQAAKACQFVATYSWADKKRDYLLLVDKLVAPAHLSDQLSRDSLTLESSR